MRQFRGGPKDGASADSCTKLEVLHMRLKEPPCKVTEVGYPDRMEEQVHVYELMPNGDYEYVGIRKL
jgi:hypothetical protein